MQATAILIESAKAMAHVNYDMICDEQPLPVIIKEKKNSTQTKINQYNYILTQ